MEYVINRIGDPFLAPLDPAHRIYWLYLCAALAIALAVFLLGDGRRARFSVGRFLRYLAPSSIYLHRSALVDYRYFIVNRIAFGLLLFPVVAVISLGAVAGVGGALHAFLGAPPFELTGGIGWILFFTLTSAVAMDFGLFASHYLQHRIPMLWEFHKVHHSAQVLTPVTAYRMHPVDDLLSMSMAGLLAGGVQGVFNFLQPGNPGPAMVLGLNGVLFAYYVAGYNLRHSHIWLSYGPVLSRVFISPAQHQVHHSKAPRHLDKNFGFIFAFWDGLFGSLYVPRGRESFEIGLANREDEEYSSIRRLYFLPFAKAMSNGMRTGTVAVLALALVFACAQSVMVVHAALTRGAADGMGPPDAQASPERGAMGGIRDMRSVYLEELTWVEVRTLVDQGVTVAIIPTGGTEQNGPHVVLGKHNYIVRHAAGEIARQLGNALVAPVIPYVPEGNIEPPSKHMRYAGTLSIPEAVFGPVLEHAARSLKAHGFKLICFVGDSGGNQKSQHRVAERLNRQWRGSGVQVLHVEAYYFGNGQMDWLMNRGEMRESIGTHAGIRDTSELLYVHPDGVRGNLLAPSPSLATTGADGDPTKASAERGEVLVSLKVSTAVRQIREALARSSARPATSEQRPKSFAVSL